MTIEVPPLYVGKVDGPEPADPLDHFTVCSECGQPVDRRDLAVVMHHRQAGHQPYPESIAFRLLDSRDWARARLLGTAAGREN